ncbi:MAG: penicillin acylase family protein [Polyangiales bacterium]
MKAGDGMGSAWARRIGLGLLVVVLLIGAAVLGALVYLRRTAPDATGETRVAKLAGDIEIVRDAHAIPHIYATSVDDAYFGLGYVHAQDRLWQLEFNRRVASGRLAELVGEAALDMDRLFRTLGLRQVAERTYTALDRETQSVLEAYARGVNQWLSEGHPLPIECRLLGCSPEPWSPADSVLFIKLLAWQLSGNWIDELWRVRLGSQLTAEQMTELLPPYAGAEAIPYAQLWQAYDALGLNNNNPRREHTQLAPALRDGGLLHGFAALTDELATLAPASYGQAIGSNNWVVDGSRSVTQKPLLANDPHLALSAPSQWYFAHLEAPGLHVIGATLPASAGVILGHNAHVAWSFTNTHPDTEDLFVERVVSGDAEQYTTPEGRRPFERRRELIKIKGGQEVEHWARSTRHGPVISDVSQHAKGLAPDGHVLALSWTALGEDDSTVAFPLRAARAENAAAFREAARSFHAPTQNMVYADDAGATGFVAAGMVPLRASDNELRGLVPAPGWLAKYDWTGRVPFDALPQQSSPASGRIVTANQSIVPRDYGHWLGADWGPSFRHDRITTLLDAQPQHSLESFAAIQRDRKSAIAEQLLPPLLAALGPPQDDAERSLIAALGAWDREMRPEASEPLVFAAWLRELSRRVYEDDLGPLFPDEWQARPAFIEAVLADRAGQARWCDDKRSAELVEDCPGQVRRALQDALVYLTQRFGPDRTRWTWGAAHPGVSAHPILGKVPMLARWFDVAAARGGDSSTVDVGSYGVADEATAFRNAWGPGFRALYDLADLERSVAILNTGQSGHVFSPHYRDMNPLWVKGEYVPLVTERARVEQGALGTWVLHAE